MEKQSIYPSILLVLVVSTTLLCSAALAAAAKQSRSAYGQSGGSPATGIIYVDGRSTGANDGSSWTDAYVYLQDALAEATTAEKPIEVRVAQGTYKPDEGANQTPADRAATFQLLDGVTLKGGYAGFGQPDPDARDIALYTTILSGDLAGNDVDVNDPAALQDEPSRADNSYHVVTGSGTDETAVLDGFFIIAGNARGADSWDGAGMYNILCSPTVANCTFYANAAAFGGGMFNLDSNPSLTNCDFAKNHGGGMYNDNSSPTIVNCAFTDNVTSHMGGGGTSNTWYSNPTLTNCVFSGNQASDGGAMYNITDSNPTLINCIFTGNMASWTNGGAIHNNGSAATLIGCTFTANCTTGRMGRGGAISNDWWSHLAVNDCTFDRNEADKGGGAIYNAMSDLTLSNCVFGQNTDRTVYNGSDAHVTVNNCTFTANTGGALCSSVGSTLMLTNSFFLGNSASVGGALDIGHCYAKLVACTFSGNSAAGSGGAILVDWPKSLKIVNCLFSGNKGKHGGALYMYYPRNTTFANCTFVSNLATRGNVFACDSPATCELTNCIFWDEPHPIWFFEELGNGPGPPPAESNISVSYSNVQGGWPGQGNIDVDPCFFDPGYWAYVNDPNIVVEPDDPNAVWVEGDYHLMSQAGRWDPETQTWIKDDVTSPCIDAGAPQSPIGYEPFPNGGYLNMGAYGGTAEASKSYFGEPVCETIVAGDINGDCRVDFADFAIMAQKWLRPTPAVFNVPPTVTILEPEDGAVFEISDSNTPIIIRADASDPDGSVVNVQFVVKHASRHRMRRRASTDHDGTDGWQFEWFWWDKEHPYPEGDFTITATAMDDEGAMSVSPAIVITVHGPE